MGIKVGIDLGTTFSAVAKIDEKSGKPEVIKNRYGEAITPSVLCFTPDGNVLFGEDAKEMQEMGDTNAVAFFKRNMGNDQFCVDFFGKTYDAADLSALFLKKLVNEAESECGERIDSAVITVPAYFTHKERQATIDAGKRAGLDVLAIINEPTAAALAYGLNGKDSEQTVLIYDLGGGTFDVTIARIDKDRIDILGSDGNHELGGKDWDDCIARYFVQQFEENYGIDLSEDDEMVASLTVKAESVKKQLTARDEVTIPIVYKGLRGTVTITENTFEDISRFLIGATKELTENLIASVGLTWKNITGVILVGGSTRMRMIHNYVKEMSGKEPLSGINVDEAVALGAAIKANMDDYGDSLIKDMLNMFDKNKTQYVIGAKKVSDVTAHALGMIAISGDGEHYENSVIIPKNTPIPTQKKRSYNFRTRAKDNELEVYVLQGAYRRPLDNTIIAKYVITNIERVGSRPAVIDVYYQYTSNGVVQVGAIQTETGKKLPIRIENVPDDMSWTDGSPKDNEAEVELPQVEILLAIDLSGSMNGEPLYEAKEAMKSFVSRFDSKYTKMGLLAFADSVRMVVDLTDNFKKVVRGIDSIRVGEVGTCNYGEPFTMALKQMKLSHADKDKDILRYLVVLTDGEWADPMDAINKAEICHSDGIEVMALGFGEANNLFLRMIASTNEFASITNLSELSSSFSKIAQTINENAGSSGIKMN